jgi:hypothetical protein
MPLKHVEQIRRPSELFVMVDTAMFWSPAGVPILQNSTSLDPVTLPWGPNQTPTTHFRHAGRTQAVSADGHAQGYDTEGRAMTDPNNQLGFVGTRNEPHYDQ